jgi:hypothetical protein
VPAMATFDDVRDIALSLPGVEEGSSRGLAEWRVRNRPLVWERPLRRADYDALGASAPDGPILGARVPDVGVQEVLAASNPDVYFVTPHFHGWPGVLVRLEAIPIDELRELIVEAWLVQAPKRMAAQWVEGGGE